MPQSYGPVSYYEPGRIYPRSRLRENWWGKDRKRRLPAPLFPPPAGPPTFADKGWIEPGQAGGWIEAHLGGWTEPAQAGGWPEAHAGGWTEPGHAGGWLAGLYPDAAEIDTMAQEEIKHTGESYPFYFKFKQHPMLALYGETLVAPFVCDQFIGSAATTDLTFSAGGLDPNDSTKVLFNISGGMDGATYKLRCKAATSGGKTVQAIGRLKVSDDY